MYISTEWSCLIYIYKGIYMIIYEWGWGLQLFPGTSLSPNARTVTVTTSWPRKKPRTHPLLSLITGSRWFKMISPSVRGKKNMFWWALDVKAIGCNWRMPFAGLFDKSHGNGSGIVKVSCMVQFWHTIPFWPRHFFIQLLQGTMFLKPSHAADLLAGFVEDLGYVMVYPNSWQFYATQL